MIQINERIKEAAISILNSKEQPENVQSLFLKLLSNIINNNEDELEIKRMIDSLVLEQSKEGT